MYEDLVFFLENNNYKKVEVLDGPGTFVLRGFIVEVFSFGEEFAFRFNFYSDTALCFVLDKDDPVTTSNLFTP